MNGRVLIATVFPIPHVGGASTHIEQLHALLVSRGLFGALLTGQDLVGSPLARLTHLLARFMDRDTSRVRFLEEAIGRLGDQIERAIPPASQSEWIIHTHDPLATCAALRSQRTACAVVQTVHGPWSRELLTAHADSPTRYHRAILTLEREAFCGADVLLPVDMGQAAILKDGFGVEPERCHIIPNAVDSHVLAAIEPSVARQLPGRFFLVPRRLVPKNGVEYAIRGFARLANRPRDLGLVIAGDGPLLSELKRVVASEGLLRDVVFLGDVQRGALLKILKRSVGVLVPSVPSHGVVEATSFSVLEAMACGVPVIASAIGGIAEIMTSEAMGFPVPAGEPAAIALAMGRVLDLSLAAKQRLLETARARVDEQFGIMTWFSKIEASYDAAMRMRSTRQGQHRLLGSDPPTVARR